VVEKMDGGVEQQEAQQSCAEKSEGEHEQKRRVEKEVSLLRPNQGPERAA
jgi:hypothetical protein